MRKLLILAALAVAGLGATAATAPKGTISGCSSVAINRVDTSNDRTKLESDVACLRGVIESATSSIKRRTDRLAKLVAIPIGVGDQAPPPLGDAVTIQPAKIPSNFDTASLLVPSWGTGAVATSGKPDVVGAFRFLCFPGQIRRDDPIVFPGQPGKSHLHQFFGNTGADASSTYASLRTTGESTCGNKLNRSAYWIPAMLDGEGSVVRPDYVSIYYKRFPQDAAACLAQAAKGCVPIPRGLRFIFGHNMMGAGPATGDGYFNCDSDPKLGAKWGHYRLIADAAPNCVPGGHLGAVLEAPNCWNGTQLDSPDHRSHMAYSRYEDDGQPHCPKTHPYLVPTFTMGIWYGIDSRGVSRWSYSSDDMRAMGGGIMPAGSTLHGDWFGAWDDEILGKWEANCINLLLNCSGGDLGNGQQLREQIPEQYRTAPRLAPIPTA